MTDDELSVRLSSLRGLDVSVSALIVALDDLSERDFDISRILSDIGLEGARKKIASRAFEGLDEKGRLSLLRSWLSVMRARPLESPPVRVCVTGINPERYSQPLLETGQAFLEVVYRAVHRVVIMGYRLNDGNEKLMKALEARMKDDGLEVCVVTDHLMNRIGADDLRSLVSWIQDGRYNFQLWSFEPETEMELMHVKCMFADKSLAYIGSANFSYGGSRRNIELGVLVGDSSVLDALDSIFHQIVSGRHKDVKKITHYDLKSAGWT